MLDQWFLQIIMLCRKQTNACGEENHNLGGKNGQNSTDLRDTCMYYSFPYFAAHSEDSIKTVAR